MDILELVLSNSVGEIGRYEVARDDSDDINLPQCISRDQDLRLAMEMLQPGDTITVVESWSEAVR